MAPDFLAVGEILRPQGLRGEIKLKPLTDDPGRFFDLQRVRVGEETSPRALHCLRVQEGFAYIRLEGVYSREAVEALRGTLLYVAREDAVPLPSDANFICDLVGLRATDTEGTDFGTLTDVLQPGGVDVYVFSTPKGEMMLPALKKTVLKVDLENKTILLDAESVRETAVID